MALNIAFVFLFLGVAGDVGCRVPCVWLDGYCGQLFAGPLNSEVRRRQSTDFLSPLNTSGLGERPKLNHATSGAGSPMRERIGSFMGRRRGDSTGDVYAVCITDECMLIGRALKIKHR